MLFASGFSPFIEGQSQVLALELECQFIYHMRRSLEGIFVQIFPTQKNHHSPQWHHLLLPNGGWVLIWGEWFKELQQECPHHGILDWLPIKTFYNNLQQSMKIYVDTSAGGLSWGKSINEVNTLLKHMASNNYHWATKRENPKKGGRHEIDAFTMLAINVDALFQKVDHL